MIQIFIVFHKTIFDECYKNIPQEVLEKYFTFIAVNENIPKSYDSNKYKVINEWELPVFDSSFQERGYNENSAIYHVYANNLHKPYDYIGFFQYDMDFNDNIIEFLQRNITEKPVCFSFQRFDFNFCANTTWGELNTLAVVIYDYEQYNKKKFLKHGEYPICNSFIIPTKNYENIMGWVSQLYGKLYPWCIQPPNASHFGHIGGIYERVMAFAIGEEHLPYIQLNVSHEHKYKNQCY